MKKSYFPQDGIWLKGNLHTHSTESDGALTPEELARAYREHGYDFLSLTDHNMVVTHNMPHIIMITGTEHDIEYSRDKCIHVVGNLPAGKSDTSYICKRYSAQEITDQQLIDRMRDDGQFVVIAHPVWSRMTPEEVMALEGYHAIEVFNNGTERLCHGGNAEVLWEMLLRKGKKLLAICCDDVHTEDDCFGGWVCVKAKERSYEAIMEAMFHGDYYSSTGPVIHDFGMEDGKAYIKCSDCREIHFVTYPPRGRSYFAEDGKLLTEETACLSGKESYIRAVCVDNEGRSAWTNPIFVD